MSRALFLLLGVLLSSCFPESFSISDGGPEDAGVDPDSDARAVDAGPADGGPRDGGLRDALPETAPSNNINAMCNMRWTELGPDPAQPCAGRRIQVVGEGLGPSAADITLLDNQEVALAWNTNEHIDSGSMELRVLNTETFVTARSGVVEPESSIGEVAGSSLSLAPDGDGVHLAYWLRRDTGSSIEYRHWSNAGVLSPAETISTQVDRSGSVSLGANARGDTTFAVHDLVTGIHFARTRLRGGELQTSLQLAEDGAVVAVDSPAVSLAVVDGVAHLAYRKREFADRASPLYRRRPGNGSWTAPATLDGLTSSSYSGIAVDIAVFEGRVAVAYLDWADGMTELRLVTWSTTPDDAVVQVLTMYSSEEAPTYTPLDVEFDSYGLLHLIFADDAGNRSLEYWREAASGTSWVRDTIIELTPEADILARMDIGPARQPHIIFTARGDVHYATISP